MSAETTPCAEEGSRACFQGTPRELADTLLQWARTTASFCTYVNESDKVSDSRLNIKSIQDHYGLLASLKCVQGNLSFPKSTVNAALKLVFEESVKQEHSVCEADFQD